MRLARATAMSWLLLACTAAGQPVGGQSPVGVAASVPSDAALKSVADKMFPYRQQAHGFLECVNLSKNGKPDGGRNDYSACPVSAAYRQHLDAVQTHFVPAGGASPTRAITVNPVADGGLIEVSLYNDHVTVGLQVSTESGRLVVIDAVHKGRASSSPAPAPFPLTPAATPSPVATPDPNQASRVIDVPWFHQAFELSCEAASLRMLLAKQGITSSDLQIMDLIGYDTRGPTWNSSGLHWGDPYTSFVGDPSGSEVAFTGYGTYHPTIQAAAARLGGRVLQAGESIAPVAIYAAISAGHPAITWVTYQWASASRQDYVAFDGRTVPFAGPVEHAVAVVGVRPDAVLVNDPWNGPGWIDKGVFERAYAVYNQMAVIMD